MAAPGSHQPVQEAEDEGQEQEGALVAALIDNRAGEVGLAVLDAAAGTLLLTQFVESTRTFVRTQ